MVFLILSSLVFQIMALFLVKNICLHKQSKYSLLNFLRKRQFNTLKNLDLIENNLNPPVCVKGMKVIDKEKFVKNIKLPIIEATCENLIDIRKHFIKYLLTSKEKKILSKSGFSYNGKLLVMNPKYLEPDNNFFAIIENFKEKQCFKLKYAPVQLNYNCWSFQDIVNAIFPENKNIGSVCMFGHVVLMNLDQCNDSYKYIIGEIMLDKSKSSTLVMNKVKVQGKFRIYSFETLAGNGSTFVSFCLNGIHYEFDIKKVFWNSKHQREYEILASKIEENDILFDVMAGVGPYALHAAKKKKAFVFANDLNTDAYEYLIGNSLKNNVENLIKCYNYDAEVFIKTIFRNEILQQWLNKFKKKVHVVMNLPVSAIDYVPCFVGVLSNLDYLPSYEDFPDITIYVYVFCPNSNKETAKELLFSRFKKIEHAYWLNDSIEEITIVRTKVHRKSVMRVTFKLPLSIALNIPDEKQLVNNDENYDKINN